MVWNNVAGDIQLEKANEPFSELEILYLAKCPFTFTSL